jgi:chorismate mutase
LGWALRGIRGATTVTENTIPAVEEAVVELLSALRERNRFEPADVACVVFTATNDLTAIFPSQIARKSLSGWEHVPLLDLTHMEVEGSLPRCIRVLLQINTNLDQRELRHVYLRGACRLRPDLA